MADSPQPPERHLLRAILRNQAALARAILLLCDQLPESPRLKQIREEDLRKVCWRSEEFAPASEEERSRL